MRRMCTELVKLEGENWAKALGAFLANGGVADCLAVRPVFRNPGNFPSFCNMEIMEMDDISELSTDSQVSSSCGRFIVIFGSSE